MEKSRIDLPIGITLDRFIKSNENQYPNAAGELSQLLRDIALASKEVNREIDKAGLIDIMGNMGQQNLGGDEQQKLDLLANIRFTRALSKGGEACGIISEETESFIDLKNKGKYIVAIDPLDGSSNIDVNVSIGTIFSIFKKQTPQNEPVCEKDFLQKGQNVVVVEDLISTGNSSLLAVEALKEAGANIKGMVAIFTYGFDIADEAFAKAGVKYQSLTNYSNLISLAVEKNIVSAATESLLMDWRKDPANWSPNI